MIAAAGGQPLDIASLICVHASYATDVCIDLVKTIEILYLTS